MGDKSAISWTDATWNPTVGCLKVSAGCERCYAIRRAYRQAAFGQPEYVGLTRKLPDGSINWTGEVRMLPERLIVPLHWKAPRRVFVDSMSDLFHDDVDEKFIAKVFAMMDLAKQHTYQVLTKRPERMARLLADEDFQFHVGWFQSQAVNEFGLPRPEKVGPWPLRNVWVGTSVEDQGAADARIPHLLATPAAVRFLSVEPMLGPVRLPLSQCFSEVQPTGAFRTDGDGRRQFEIKVDRANLLLHWVITGGESGPKHRPFDPQWARDLRDQCQAAGVSFFHKQNGGRTHSAGGDLLDGRQWHQFPDEFPTAREAVSA